MNRDGVIDQADAPQPQKKLNTTGNHNYGGSQQVDNSRRLRTNVSKENQTQLSNNAKQPQRSTRPQEYEGMDAQYQQQQQNNGFSRPNYDNGYNHEQGNNHKATQQYNYNNAAPEQQQQQYTQQGATNQQYQKSKYTQQEQQQQQQQQQSSSKSKEKSCSYSAERIVGNGSFGVVYRAYIQGTNEIVAIKKVLQDKRFKNRELEIMYSLKHPCVIEMKHCFYSYGGPTNTDVYLNLVMEYIPDTIHRLLRDHNKAGCNIALNRIKVYAYQIFRSLAYIHSIGVCHRDIKPQNILLDQKSHQIRLCDFGSAKILVPGEPNVAYICSRYYRAPELVCEASEYTIMIDVWSVGCVIAELITTTPLFPGENGSKQLDEIVTILGTPTLEERQSMNRQFNGTFLSCDKKKWSDTLGSLAPDTLLDLIDKLLQYNPLKRLTAVEAMAHPFFEDIRHDILPPEFLTNVHTYTEDELRVIHEQGYLNAIITPHVLSILPPNLQAVVRKLSQ